MKFIKTLMAATFLLGGAFSYADEVASGKVICSLNSPVSGGFELVKVRSKDRRYTGTYEVENLMISGAYQSSLSSLILEVQTLDEDGEPIQQLLHSEAKLQAGEYWRSKTRHENNVEIDIYCHFIKDRK